MRPPTVKKCRERLVLTPEHVRVRLVPAGLGSRFAALMTDTFLIMALVTALSTPFFFLPAGLNAALTLTLSFVVHWGYHLYFEVWREGRSPGKRLVGLRVVDGRGLPVTLPQSMVRNVVRVLDFAPVFYGLGALVSLLDPDRRRLGDIAADTLVIRDRPTASYDPAVAAPRRFNSLRTPGVLRRIRHRVSLEERELLLELCLRSAQLDDEVRYDLMEEVGGVYREKLGIDDPHLSAENLVRDLTAILFDEATSVRGGWYSFQEKENFPEVEAT
ncbi:MAG: RDD family protein [bacterium]|nr:RDD family protein [bacterium]